MVSDAYFLENLGDTSDRFQEVKQGSPVNFGAKKKPENNNDGVESVDKNSDDVTVCCVHHVLSSSSVCVLSGVQPCVGVLDVRLLFDPCHLCFLYSVHTAQEDLL